jgi:hypothetical protein
MRRPRPRTTAVLGAALLLATALPLAAVEPSPRPSGAKPGVCAAQDADNQDPRPHCCFTNARYVGTCEVEPAKDETCASILAYLNDPQSQAKAYCNRTNVRGGWKEVPCEPKMKQD